MRRFVDEVRPRFAGGGWRGKILPGSEWAWPQGASVSRWPPRDMSMDGKTRVSRDLRIRLFGGPVLEHMGRPVDLSPFHGVLLSILAYHGRRGIRRDRLLSFLWPAGPEGALRHRLSQVVYSMHQRIGVPELVIMAGDRFFLDVDRVAPDLETFHTALQERRIDEALSLLDQEFLAEVNPVPTPDLEVWIGERVRQFRADIRTAGARLWGESEQRGDWERASRTADLLLRLDPTDEELLRKVIRARGLTGHVAEARATYREFFERMEALAGDWVPAAETIGLLSRLDTLARERGPTFLLGRYGLPAQPPLVGREEELATLGRLLRDPTDGQVAGIGVVGEPGVGKTRLSWEALRSLPFDGVRVLAARCSEFERRIPLAPFTSALKPAWVGETARDLEDPWRAVLLSIFPEWHREPGPPPVVPEIETSEVPRRLCEAFRRLFIALVRTDPVVLFIDDFHWADETSLAVLDYIRHRGVDGDLKVLVTVEDSRMAEPEGHAMKGGALRWLDADRTSVRFAVPPLTQDQALQLATVCATLRGDNLDPAEVVRTAGRSPLLIAEVANNWGFLQDAAHRGVASLPPTFQDIIVDPILSLPDCERSILNVIALALQPLPAGALLEYLEESFGTDANRAVGELLRRGLVELTSEGFQPSSALVAWSVCQMMPSPERITICAAYARGLFGESVEPAVLAHYARECQDFAGARRAYEAAAQRAWERGAGFEAVTCLSEAFEIAPPGPEWEEAQIQLAEGLLRARMLPEAIPHLTRSESLLMNRGERRRAFVHRANRQGARLLAGPSDDTGVRRRLWQTVDAAAAEGSLLPAAIGLDLIARHAQRVLDIDGLNRATERASGLLADATDMEAKAHLLMSCSLQAFAGIVRRGSWQHARRPPAARRLATLPCAWPP
jgi:DNA-binding SARP family transcriptional activator